MSNPKMLPFEDFEGDEDEPDEEEALLPTEKADVQSDIDINALAQKVYERLRREVLIERERLPHSRGG